MKRQQLTIRLDDNLNDILTMESHLQEISKGKLVRHLLRQAIGDSYACYRVCNQDSTHSTHPT